MFFICAAVLGHDSAMLYTPVWKPVVLCHGNVRVNYNHTPKHGPLACFLWSSVYEILPRGYWGTPYISFRLVVKVSWAVRSCINTAIIYRSFASLFSLEYLIIKSHRSQFKKNLQRFLTHTSIKRLAPMRNRPFYRHSCVHYCKIKPYPPWSQGISSTH